MDVGVKSKRRRRLRTHKTVSALCDHGAHDLRGPLTVIKEYVSLLQDGLCGSICEEQRHALCVIDDRADDLSLLVDNLLTIGKRHAGTLSAIRKECLVSGIVTQVVHGQARKAALKRVTLESDVPPGLPPAFADPDMIASALWNLSVCALNSFGQPTRVLVWARQDPQNPQLWLGVTGDGLRIGAEGHQAILRQLQAVVSGGDGDEHGIRLELAAARALVNVNCGELRVARAANRGISLFFGVPLTACDESGTDVDEESLPAGTFPSPE